MKNYLRICFIILAICAGSISWSYCDIDTDTSAEHFIRVIKGNISSVNWVGSEIVVKTFDDETTIFVSHSTRITKRGVSIQLSDINISDKVTVEYYNDSPGPLKAVSITVKA